jgi:ribosomal RNA-processing protein 9
MAKLRKKRGLPQGGNKGRSKTRGKGEPSGNGGGDFERDSFFERDNDAEKKRRRGGGDEELYSSEDDDRVEGRGEDSDDDEMEEEEEDLETADEKRLRVARAYLEKVRDSAVVEEDEDNADETEEGRRGAKDSLVADLLRQEQLEESGRAQRKLASR